MHRVFLLACVAAAAGTALGNGQEPTLEVRLGDTLTSYRSAAGSQVLFTVISPFETGGRIVIPAGSLVHATIRKASGVGIGLVHERASLDLRIDHYQLPDGRIYKLDARVASVDNAREQVTSKGRIHGVMAAGSPYGFLRGVWFRPSFEHFGRSFLGLTGAGGKLWSSYSMGPIGVIGMFAVRCILYQMPEPEIQFPAGTEMRLAITSIPEDAPSFDAPAAAEVPESLASWLAEQTIEITKSDAAVATDIINLAFIGSEEDLRGAFTAAGWVEPDRRTARSLSREYQAYGAMSGYPAAPMSKLFYHSAESDLSFEKSLNTVARRHHIRIWRGGLVDGKEVWLGAATHDTGISMTRASVTFNHKVDPRIDRERSKVVSDLAFAGCSGGAAHVDRPAVARAAQDGNAETDGRLAVVWLTPCARNFPDVDPPAKPGSALSRLTRRIVLEGRYYVLRDNIYYWSYRAMVQKRRGTP